MKNLKTKQQGFTIIEVMIVLVIAAVILLIVFLAVPALQRNSRNTQRKNDAAAALAAVNEWSNNNNGGMPTSNAQQTEALANAKLGIFNGVTTWGTTWPSDPNALVIAVNQKCASESTLTSQNRSVSVLYRVESSSVAAGVQQCEEG